MIEGIFQRVNNELLSKKSKYLIYVVIVSIAFLSKNVRADTESINEQENKQVERYKVAKLNIEEVSGVYSVTLWILLGSLIKIGISKFKRKH
jgi:hypothetical protein